VRSKKLNLPIDKIFSLGEAKAAQEYMRANQHFGKILLIP
jgi:NADPH2:quinone reductase